MPELSVIICTHNPRPDYLQRTLAALKIQTLPKDKWELLLVDNASQKPAAQSHELTWHPLGRHVREETLGLTPARQRGIKESTGAWLVFVDDDNLLAEDYLAKVLAIASQHPQLAVLGAGKLKPEFETPPPPELKNLLHMLALREVAEPHWGNNPKDLASLPCGAGLCAERAVAERFDGLVNALNKNLVLGRKGKQLFSNEDDLFSWVAADAGRGFGVFPELRITHLIAAGRLQQPYFLRLIYFSAFSHWIMHYSLAGTPPGKIRLPQLVRLGLHALKNGVFSARCQWGWLKGEHEAARFIAEKNLRPVPGRKPKNHA